MNASRRVLYVSGTRADFGLMQRTLVAMAADQRLELGVAVTGMHLLESYGFTVAEIEAAGLPVVARIPVALDGSGGGVMARALAAQLDGLVTACEQWQPDLLLLLGDRGEMLAGALAAVHLGIPVAHIHGGERSGTVDESLRHAISKLAHLHLVATEQSRQRLMRMGERPEQIWVVGAPGLDGLRQAAPSHDEARAALCGRHGLDPARPLLLVLFHPVLQEAASAAEQARALLGGITAWAAGQPAPQAPQLLVLAPNSDGGGAAIAQVWQQQLPASGLEHRLLTHLPRQQYLEALAGADALVGNSSSGIIEAASFDLPVLDLGSRQQARERSTNVRHAPLDAGAIADALAQILARGREPTCNVYGDGGASERIVELLATTPLPKALLAKLNSY